MPTKTYPPVQEMAQDTFVRAAKATPLYEGSAYYEIWLGDRFIGFERGHTPHQAAERAHEHEVKLAIMFNMPNSARWDIRPMPSANAVLPYPHLEDRYDAMLASKKEVTI